MAWSSKETRSPISYRSSRGENSGESRGALLREALAMPTERGEHARGVSHIHVLKLGADEWRISLKVEVRTHTDPFCDGRDPDPRLIFKTAE